MRIGIVLAAVPGYSETFFRSKIKGLKEHGFEVILFAHGPKRSFHLCPYIPGPKAEMSLNELFYFFSSLMQLLFSHPMRMLRFLKAERHSGRDWMAAISNLVFSSHILRQQLDWLHFGFGTMALGKENIAKAMGAKMAISHRGYDLMIYPLKFPGCYGLAWQLADKIHVLSDVLKEKVFSFGLNRNKEVEKITPAIDINLFKSGTKELMKSNQVLRILTVARLKWVKGLDYSLQAMAFLRKCGIDFTYTIIGEGEEHERLVFAAHQLGICERVQFAGKKAPEEVKQAMQECDLYLQYSISEGFCNAVLEAQAMGCLCVVSNADGLPENVIHGVTGWVVPKRKPKLLAEQILQLTKKDSENLNEIRLNAIQRIQTNFQLEDQITSFIDFYKN